MAIDKGDKFRDQQGRIWEVYTLADDTEGMRAILVRDGEKDQEIPISLLKSPFWTKDLVHENKWKPLPQYNDDW